MKKIMLMLLLLVSFTLSIKAEIILPSLFGDNMVLQQNAKVKIWGKANAFTKLSATCSWNNRTFSAKADEDGRWEMYIETSEAGGPYEIHLSNMLGGEKMTLSNVYIGEVWICSGQSNMVHPVRGYLPKQPIDGSEEAIADAVNYKNIHSFIVPRDSSSVRQESCGGEWVDGSPENIAKVSANAYFFAKKLCRTLDIPIGIIVSSWGSSRIETWMSEETLRGIESVDMERLMQERKIQKRPTLAYNAMIAPIEGYTARGFAWCQLGANRHEYSNYPVLLSALVESWRTAWNDMDMPFISLQGVMYAGDGSADKITYPLIIEKQYEARNLIDNYYMVTATDIMSSEPHYPQKEITGGRIADMALKYAYGHDDIHPDAPDFESVRFTGNEAVVTFTNAGEGMVCDSDEILAFELSGADKHFHPAKARIVGGNKVVVTCEQVARPVALRYAFHNYRDVSLFNSHGVTPRLYRTDNWDDVY